MLGDCDAFGEEWWLAGYPAGSAVLMLVDQTTVLQRCARMEGW